MIHVLPSPSDPTARAAEAQSAGTGVAEYWGKSATRTITPTACNAVANAQVPGTTDLFVGRSFFHENGTPMTIEEGCRGEALRNHRGGLVLSRLEWQSGRFAVIKPLFVNGAIVTGGPMRGAILNGIDPDMVIYRGQYLLAFECRIKNQNKFGVQGNSACITQYDPAGQKILLDRTYVVVSGKRVGERFWSASVPQLLVYKGNLFLYWSRVAVMRGAAKFLGVSVLGVRLEPDNKGFYWAAGARRTIETSDPRAVEVWGPDPGNSMSDTAVDIKSVWAHGNNVIMLAGLGGGGCAGQGPQPGCFRMAIAMAPEPLGSRIFNRSARLHEAELPTNGQGYTRPVRNPSGGYSFIGAFYKPKQNGFSEKRSVATNWSAGNSQIVTFPFPDRNLWPTGS